MVYDAKSGHVGGSRSAIDIIPVLNTRFLKHRFDDPDLSGRDRFITSRSAACQRSPRRSPRADLSL